MKTTNRYCIGCHKQAPCRVGEQFCVNCKPNVAPGARKCVRCKTIREHFEGADVCVACSDGPPAPAAA